MNDINLRIGSTIRFLREAKKLTQNELGNILKVSASSIGMYEQGRRSLDPEMILKLSNFFCVSTDFLLSNSIKPLYEEKSNGYLTLGDTIKLLRITSNLTQLELGNILNVGKSTVSQYENNINSPDIDMLIKIANYFNVSVDYLLGRTNYSNESELINELNRVKNELNTICKRITDLKMR